MHLNVLFPPLLAPPLFKHCIACEGEGLIHYPIASRRFGLLLFLCLAFKHVMIASLLRMLILPLPLCHETAHILAIHFSRELGPILS